MSPTTQHGSVVVGRLHPVATQLAEFRARWTRGDGGSPAAKLFTATEAAATMDDATDVLWLHSYPVLYRRLVGTQGWSTARFEK